MTQMKEGDPFEENNMYLAYYHSTHITSQFYIFSVRNPYIFYQSKDILSVDVFKYVSISHRSSYHVECTVYYDFSLNFLGVEVWELTDDEAMNILSEVI
jgi:hypothetical protein